MIKSFGRYDIFELELSSKPYFALTECGIEKLADLLKMTKGDLKKIPNLDKSGRTEIKRTLKMIQEHYISEPEPPDYRAQLDELIGLEGVKSR